MSRVVPGGDCRQVELGEGGPTIHRRKGAFHVNDRQAKQFAAAVGGFVAGTRIGGSGPSEPLGPWCVHGLRPFYCEECTA